MDFNNTYILYIGIGMHKTDPVGAITTGTTRLDLINCRSNQKTMQIIHVFTLSRTDVTKDQFYYWENKKLTPMISNLLEKTRVIYDTDSMNGKCPGRTNNWWLLNDTTIEEEKQYVKKEFETYDQSEINQDN